MRNSTFWTQITVQIPVSECAPSKKWRRLAMKWPCSIWYMRIIMSHDLTTFSSVYHHHTHNHCSFLLITHRLWLYLNAKTHLSQVLDAAKLQNLSLTRMTFVMAFSDGKVRFSSVQRGISLNLEPNSQFSSGHFAEPRTGPTVQVQFWFELVRTSCTWEKYFWHLFLSKILESVNIYYVYLV